MHRILSVVLAGTVGAAGVTLGAQQVTRETVPGITNFARVETTVACAGATPAEAMADIRRLGFASIINLRQASEKDANVEQGSVAAKAAGLRYLHLPFNGSAPDPASVDRFLEAVTDPANQPVFIHCASGNRAAALWMIKRVLVDGWDLGRASTEAALLGLTSSALKDFVLRFVERRRG